MKRVGAAIFVVALGVVGFAVMRKAEPPIVREGQRAEVTGEEARADEAKQEPTSAPGAMKKTRPRVDLVFVLDTTGSMASMIAGAKAKIWEIARKTQEGDPAPEVRLGLVAYRDRGDEYVTRVADLTGDVDEIYKQLTELSASGGGDFEEHVLKGLDDAVNKVHWSEDANAVKLIYLVGDAPPHLDYQDGVTLEGVLGEAKKKGITISAIRCGSNEQTLESWEKFASSTGGDAATIEQGGGVVVTATPFDKELADLNARLAATEIHYGTSSERLAAASAVAAGTSAPLESQAERATFLARKASLSKLKGSEASAPSKKDLVESPASLGKLPEDQLPEAMRAMSPEERVKYVEAKKKERDELTAQILEVSRKRQDFLVTRAPKPSADSLDSKVYKSLKRAGEKSGISY